MAIFRIRPGVSLVPAFFFGGGGREADDHPHLPGSAYGSQGRSGDVIYDGTAVPTVVETVAGASEYRGNRQIHG